MVVRVEAIFRELLGDQNRHDAVVREAGVIAAVLHCVVVRVEHVEVQPVLRSVLGEQNHQLVRAVLVHVIVHVHAVAGLAAVTDHVHLDHADHRLVLDARDNVRVGVAAVETLLFAGEVAETNRAVRLHLQERLRDLHHADGAGAIIVRAGSSVFRLPGPTGSRVEVGAEIENLLRIHRAGELDDEVEHLATAHLVLVTGGLEADAGVELLEILHRQFDVAVVAVARLQRHGLAVDADRHFARQLAQSLFDIRLLDGSKEVGDTRVGRVSSRLDAGALLAGGATNFLGVELAVETLAGFVRGMHVRLPVVTRVERSRAVEALPHDVGGGACGREKRERDENLAQMVHQVSHTITLTFLMVFGFCRTGLWEQKQQRSPDG